jgi:hypothetical protein
MKSNNRRTVHSGVIHHTRILATIKELQEKISSWVTKSRSSRIQTHHSHLGYKQHHGHRSSNQSLSWSTMGTKTLDSSSWAMKQPWIQHEMMSHWPNLSPLHVKAQSSTSTPCYHRTEYAVGSTSRKNSYKLSRYSMKLQQNHQTCTILSRKTESHCRTL